MKLTVLVLVMFVLSEIIDELKIEALWSTGRLKLAFYKLSLGFSGIFNLGFDSICLIGSDTDFWSYQSI